MFGIFISCLFSRKGSDIVERDQKQMKLIDCRSGRRFFPRIPAGTLACLMTVITSGDNKVRKTFDVSRFTRDNIYPGVEHTCSFARYNPISRWKRKVPRPCFGTRRDAIYQERLIAKQNKNGDFCVYIVESEVLLLVQRI